MTFKMHKEYCTGCQSGLFCNEGLALLQQKPYTQQEVEDGIKAIEEEIEAKKPKVKTDADKFLTKKQRWRKYKKNIKKGSDKVGLSKFKRN